MFTPKSNEVDLVLRSSALSYFYKLTSENSNSEPAANEGDNSSEALQLAEKPVLIDKNLQRFKWLFGALADLVFCLVSRSDLLMVDNEIKGFSKEPSFSGSSDVPLQNDVLKLANAIRTNLIGQSKWENLMDENRKNFLITIDDAVVTEIMKETSNRVFKRVKLEHVYNPGKNLKDVIKILWGRVIEANQIDSQPWYTAWIIQPANERRIKANGLLRQAIELLTSPEMPIGSDAQNPLTNALIVKEACRLAEIAKDSETKDFKDTETKDFKDTETKDFKETTEILGAEFNTILAYEFDTSGYLSKQEFIAAFKEKLIEQENSRDDQSDFSNVDETSS